MKKGFGKSQSRSDEHPIYHKGIDRFVDRILTTIAVTQFRFRNKIVILLTNDLPDDPQERSLGLTESQITELQGWLDANQSRLPKNLEIRVLQADDRPRHGMLWKLKDFTKLLTRLQL